MIEQTATAQSLNFVLAQDYFAELKNNEYWQIDLKYATADNFMYENMYHEFNRAFLHKDAFKMLQTAASILKKTKPNYKFIIYDVLRPRSVQWKMWNKVKGTDHQQYIANPESGSNHNFGMAIDLSILDEQGQVLDMGTGFDEFSEVSQPKFEERFVASGQLTTLNMQNRSLLKNCLEQAGFKQLPSEWWHFDALSKLEIREKYKIVE